MTSRGKDLRALAKRARRSDPDAWEELYRRSYAPLLDYALRRTGSKEEADDAVGEAFARAHAASERFRWRGGGLDAWLYGILRNVLLESYRSSYRRIVLADLDRPSFAPGPPEEVIALEESADVRSALARLTEDDREVLELRMIGRLSPAEAGRVLGRKPGAIRMAQSRALIRLRSLMAERGT